MKTGRRCVLEGGRLGTAASVYDALQAQLGLPAHFGRNLDALWDALTTDVPGPIEIVWRGSAASRAALGPEFDRILDVLRAAEATRKDLTVTLA